MALLDDFPNFGPIREYEVYAMRGLDQGGALFKYIAGFSDNGTEVLSNDLHYIALTFALVGGLSFLLIPRMRELKNILCWLFIVLVLIVGPYGNKAFFYPAGEVKKDILTLQCKPIKDHQGKDIPNEECAGKTQAANHYFTPHVVIIDAASRLHHAMHDAFFGENGFLGRNIADTTKAIPAFKEMPQLTLASRPDLQQEVSIFSGICSNGQGLNLLTKSPYNENVSIENGLASTPVTLSKTESDALKFKTFTLQDVVNGIHNHTNHHSGMDSLTYPPFGIYYDGPNLIQYTDPDDKSDNPALKNEDDNLKRGLLKYDEKIPHSNDSKYSVGQIYSKIYGINYPEENYNFNNVDAKTPQESKVYSAAAAYSLGLPVDKHTNRQNMGKVRSLIPYYYVPLSEVIDSKKDADNNYYEFSSGTLSYRSTVDSWTGFYTTQNDVIDERVEGNTPDLQQGIDKINQTNLQQVPVALGLLRKQQAEFFESSGWASFLQYSAVGGVRDAAAHYGGPFAYDDPATGDTQQVVPTSMQTGEREYSVVHNCQQFHKDLNDRIARHLLVATQFPEQLISGIAAKYNKIDTFPTTPTTNVMHTGRKEVNILREAYNNYIDPKEKGRRDQNYGSKGGDVSKVTPEVYREFIRKELLRLMITSTFQAEDYYIRKFDPAGAVRNQKIQTASTGEDVIEKFKGPGQILAGITDFISDKIVVIGSWFQGGKVLAYLRFLKIVVSIAILFVLMLTPLLMMMGLLIPSYAPGVLVLTIGSMVVLKAIPIMYTVTDAAMTIVAKTIETSQTFSHNTDQALMLYVMATVYTSIVGVTMWVMFKSGDAGQLANLQQLDGAANKVAETAEGFAKALAVTGAALATGGGAAGLGALAKGKGLSGAALAAAKQGKEVISNSASDIPVVGQVLREANPASAWREGSAYVDAVDKAREMEGSDYEGKGRWAAAMSISSDSKNHDAFMRYKGEVTGAIDSMEDRQTNEKAIEAPDGSLHTRETIARSKGIQASKEYEKSLIENDLSNSGQRAQEVSRVLGTINDRIKEEQATVSKKAVADVGPSQEIVYKKGDPETDKVDKEGYLLDDENKRVQAGTRGGLEDSVAHRFRDEARKIARNSHGEEVPDQIITKLTEKYTLQHFNSSGMTSTLNTEVAMPGGKAGKDIVVKGEVVLKEGHVNHGSQPIISDNVMNGAKIAAVGDQVQKELEKLLEDHPGIALQKGNKKND